MNNITINTRKNWGISQFRKQSSQHRRGRALSGEAFTDFYGRKYVRDGKGGIRKIK